MKKREKRRKEKKARRRVRREKKAQKATGKVHTIIFAQKGWEHQLITRKFYNVVKYNLFVLGVALDPDAKILKLETHDNFFESKQEA